MPIIKARASSIIESIDLRGTPTAPTAQQSVNTSQLASTAYVRTAVADLINSSPEVLDTLAELAAALGNDENFSVTVANSIATKVPLDGSVAMTGRLTLSANPTDNLHAVTKQYVDQAIDDQMIYSTDDVAEGSNNLYYTNARVRSAVSLFSDNTTVLDYNSSTGQFTYNHPSTDGILEGASNLYFTTARARNSISLTSDDATIISYSAQSGQISFTTPDTDQIAEGQTNLYFTTARARASLSNGSNIAYDNGTGVISTQAAVWSVNGQEHDVVLDTDDVSEGSSNLYFTQARARGSFSLTTDDSNILSYNSGSGTLTWTTPSTDAIDEGSSNLYYTDTRVRAAISGSGDISYNQATGNFSYSTPTTDGVNEGSTNLYYTNSRARNAVSLNTDNASVLSYDNTTGEFTFSLGSQTTDDVAEGTNNLYFTTGRARNSISASGWSNLSYDNSTGVISISAPSTADVTEDPSNLYYTNTRARNAVSAIHSAGDGDLTYDNTTGVFDYVGPTATDYRQAVSAVKDSGHGDLQYSSTTGVFTYTGPTNTNYRNAVSATDAGGDGSFDYNSSTGVFTYTGPSASETRAHFSVTDTGGDGSLEYNSSTGVITYTGPSDSEVRAHFSVTDTGGDGSLEYNSSTGVFTYTGPSDSEVRAHFSVNDTGGDGSLEYNSSTGVITYTGPSASETRAHFSATTATGAQYNSSTGVISLSGIPNSSLTNSDVTVNGYSIALGGSQTLDTDDIGEGSSNLYYLDSRARNAISLTTNNSAVLDYNSATGEFTFNLAGTNTDEVTEGSTNLYFTTQRARDSVSATDAGGDGSFSYDSATGAFTYTGPSATEVRAHLSATSATGVQYNDTTGVISLSGIPNSSLTNSDITLNGTTVSLGGSNSFTTDAVNEGTTNKYYTSARVRSELSANDVENSGSFSYSSATGEFSFDATGVVAEVNGYKGYVTLDTDDISEGSNNLYYTTARTRADVGAGTGVHYDQATGVFSIGQAVETTSNVTFNDVTVSGDLTVNGTLTTINSTTVTVADKNITIADGAANAAAANGAGITVAGAGATITYASADDSWNLNKDVNITGGLTITQSLTAPTFVGDLTGNVTGQVSDISNHDTDELAEGANNLYFTNARARNAISLTSDKTSVLSYNSGTGVLTFTIANASTSDIAEGTNLYYTDARARASVSVTDNGGDGSLSYDSSTGVISYTGPSASETRAHFSATTATGAQYDSSTGVFSLSGIPNSSLTNNSVTVNGATVALGGTTSFGTDSVTEESNLYYLDSRARNALSVTTSDSTVFDYDPTTGEFTFSLGGLDTSEVTEDPNATVSSGTMYFTDARSRAAVSATDAGGDGSFSYNSSTGVFTYTGPSASETRAHFSASTSGTGYGDLSYNSSTGAFTYDKVTSADIRGEVSATKTGGDGNFSYDEPTGTFSYTGPDATDYRLAISVSDNGGDGSLSYDDSTGVISYTGPSASEARAHFSATKVGGDGAFSYNSSTGAFSYTGPDDADYRTAISVTKVSGDGSISYNDTTGVISYTGPNDSEVRAHFSATTATGAQYNSSTGVFSLSGIPNSSLTNDSITINGTTVALGASNSFGTDSVTEENNLYFTDSRARSAISLTTNDSTVLDYNSSTGEFTFNLGGLDTSEVAEDPNATTSSGTMYFTNARARSAISASGWQISYDSATGVISMATPDTDDVAEGDNNLYFTNSRARTAVSLTSDNTDAMNYDSTTGVFTFTLATVDTDEIAEGNTNLYFTTARARNTIVNGANIDYDASTGIISTQAAVWSVNGQNHAVVLDTDDIDEGSTNLYFTDARARSALTLTTDDSNILSYNSGTGTLVWVTPTTDSIDEGATNLYYTNARADDRIAAASIRDLSDVNKTASLQDGYTLVWSSVLGEFVPQNIAVQATTANFTGDGTTTSFNTGVEVSSIDNTSVFINGLIQAPTYSYTLSTSNGETSIVFDTAPEANDYIFVRVISSASLNVGGVLNENSTVDGGSF